MRRAHRGAGGSALPRPLASTTRRALPRDSNGQIARVASRRVVRVRVRYFVGKARADAYPDAMAHRRAAACLVNAARLDFDAKLDLSKIADACGGASCLTRHDDSTPSPAVIATRATNHDIVITKEVPVDVHLLPPSVKLICEAGTGYNNVDLDAAKRRGIVVCNVPTYSTDAVAHLVVTHVLNFSGAFYTKVFHPSPGFNV